MRRLFSIAFIVLAVVVATLKVAEWTTEEWWMNAMGFHSAQVLYWQWRVEAFVPAFGLWMLVMGTNAQLAWHNARWRDVSLPLLGPRALAGRTHISPEDRVRLDVLARRGSQVFMFMSALLCGMAAANQFDLWVLALHPPSFGELDASANAAFLVAVWPALLWAWNAFGVLLGFTLGLVVIIGAFEGVLDFDTHGLRVGDATARHLSFLVSLVLVWLGVRCGLSALGEPINFGWSANGVSGFYETSFTNPTRTFFLLSSLPLAFWFARTAPRDALRPVVVALFWTGSALFVPLMAPSFGRAMVAPSLALDEKLRQEQTRHIALTRYAWALERVQKRQLNVTATDFMLSPTQSLVPTTASEKTPGLVVWPQEALRGALHENDTGQGSGRSGQGRRPSQLYVAREGNALRARIIESDPSATSVTSSLTLETDPARAGRVEAQRRPFKAMILQSPTERNAVSTRNPNLDPIGDGSTPLPHAHVRELEEDENFGVTRPNALANMALALRFGDQSLMQGEKPLTWHLDPLERVQTLAPFVWWTDAQPHPVWMPVQGEKSERLYWLVEGCFVSRSFPGSAMIPVGGEWSSINYGRQSVLGVCDATTGQTRFFLFDPDEPLSRAWNALMPGFFRPASELPAALRAGTRLSQALLNAQSVIWARYHQAPAGTDDVLYWTKRRDVWRPVGGFDTSERNTLVQQVLIERGGKAGLELVAAFAPWGGVVTSDSSPADNSNTTRLIAMLGARDEGETIWKSKGQTTLSEWRAKETIELPLSDSPSEAPLSSPFAPDIFYKFAIVPLLDAEGNCVGMQISQGKATRKKQKNGFAPWSLENRVASTKTQFVVTLLPSRPTSVQTDQNLKRLRDLWKSWKSARANGRWERVEELEAEITRALGAD